MKFIKILVYYWKIHVSLTNAIKKELLMKKPWVLIYPLTNGKHHFISYLKEKYNAVTIGFSGWAINKNYCNIMNLDYAIPFSDHCDFNELVEVVKKSKPEKDIYCPWISKRICALFKTNWT